MSKPVKPAPMSTNPPICDYEGSNYRTEFWEGKGRDYEDRVERIAVRRLLPESGKRLLEIGAGFGRLSDEFNRFEHVVLLDYSFSQMQYAQEHHGKSAHFTYVAADAYKLPFRPGVFDAATMIRVIHHMSNVPQVLSQVRRVLAPNAIFVLEHANKRNVKAMLRYALKKQAWNPNDPAPVEFVELNFDFHPDYIANAVQAAGFKIMRRVPVSYFRLPQIKSMLPTGMLAGMDGLMQTSGLLYSPSVFMRAQAHGQTIDQVKASSIFVCPECGGELVREGDEMVCQNDGLRWAIRDGIYDFKAPLNE
jgi:ubiquinone/menaquinone biosynthesis C-methylase UbiE/predicted RNA-binding Zn-ribbon protein involved in translation (DUF1610 family)